MERLCAENTGLFPAPAEIRFSCSCPDWAAMCKHVAAVLYGVGARLDDRPDLLFELRGVDQAELIAGAGTGVSLVRDAPATSRVLADEGLAEMFGIDLGEAAPPASPKRPGSPKPRRPAKAARKKPAKGISARDRAPSPRSARSPSRR
jgi:uncharacterized Zn finger protein